MYSLVTVAVVAYIFVRLLPFFTKWRLKREASPLTSILFSYMSQHGEILELADGYTPGNMWYSYLVALDNTYSNEATLGIYSVELPFVSAAHIVGIAHLTDYTPAISLDIPMEELKLEGNYAKHFSAYTESGMQASSRYVLDPAAMNFTIDFCAKYHWEIVGSYLYFLCYKEVPSFEIVDTFVTKIRPAIVQKNDVRDNAANLPYTFNPARRIQCPICQQRMVAANNSLSCANHHGSLLTGKQIFELRDNASLSVKVNALKISSLPDISSETHLTCTYCGAPMTHKWLEGTKLYVDDCTKCQFWWIDQDQLEQLTVHTPHA